MKMLARFLLLFFVLPTTISRLSAASTSPSISFEPTHVVATGFHSGQDIVIFGVATAPGPYFSQLLRYTDTLVPDAAGTVRYEIVDGVPDRSIWFAVDVQTREYAVAAARGAVLRSSLSTPVALSSQDVIGLHRRLNDLLIVRPGGGVWIGSCSRNSAKDLNRGKGGAVQLSVTQMVGAPKTAGHPSVILPSDLIVVVDSETLEYFVGNIKQF